jgi:anti-anti-sigma factor
VRPLARIAEEWRDDLVLARIEGEIDASNVADIGSRLRSLLSNHSTAMVVDLSATTYLDSAAINLLFALRDEMGFHQQRLALVIPDGSSIGRMISLTGLDRTVAVRPTADAAVAVIRQDG